MYQVEREYAILLEGRTFNKINLNMLILFSNI